MAASAMPERRRVVVIDRAADHADALQREARGQDWSMRHVMAVLDCSRASLYRNRWLMSKRIQQPGGFVWKPKEVRLFQALQTGTKQRRKGA